jgi:hypothetical protein
MKFRYDGPFDEVEVPELGVLVQRGRQVEASGPLAESFDAQTDWTRVDKPKPRKPAKKTAAPKTEQATPPATDQTSTEE